LLWKNRTLVLLAMLLSWLPAGVSLQEFSRGELTSHHGAVRQQVEDERRRREEMLNVRQSLAEQVSQRSQQFHAGNMYTLCIL